MATKNITPALNELAEAHTRMLRSMDDDELLALDPSSPLEAELMLRLEVMREMYEDSDDLAVDLQQDLQLMERVSRVVSTGIVANKLGRKWVSPID